MFKISNNNKKSKNIKNNKIKTNDNNKPKNINQKTIIILNDQTKHQ